MKNVKFIALVLSLVLLITSIPFIVFAEEASASNSINEFPVCTNDEIGPVSAGYGGSQKIISAADATAAGAPQGEGYVLSITNDSNVGFNLDLRKSDTLNYKISDVESMTFKVWVSSKIYEFRLRTKSGSSWQKQIKITPAEGAWIEVELTDMSIFVDDGNGYFSPFNIGFRGNTDAAAKVYVDSITLKLKEGVVPPSQETETEAPETTETEAPTETETETPVAPDPLYYDFDDGKGKEEIPYGVKSSDGTWYGYNNFKMMDEAQAKYAKVPDGYSGWVLAIDPNGGNTSIGLDLTAYRVKTIKKITFRLWCPTGTKQHDTDGGIRLSGAATNSWAWKASPSAIGEWLEVTLEKDDYSFLDFDNDGYCNAVNLCLRGATATAYIDAITVELKPNDGVAPEIRYNGETIINTSAGKPFVIDVSAYDEQEDRNITPEIIWSEGALDESGLLLEGNHTCTIKATDGYGNVSEIVLTVNVSGIDTEAPVISWTPDEVFAVAGMIPMFDITAEDNVEGEIEVNTLWSEGALDEGGRLTAGQHTLTLSVTDLTGNKAEHTVYVFVFNTRPTIGDLVKDSNN